MRYFIIFAVLFSVTVATELSVSLRNSNATLHPNPKMKGGSSKEQGILPVAFDMVNVLDGTCPCVKAVKMIKRVGIAASDTVSKLWTQACKKVGPHGPLKARIPCEIVHLGWNDIVRLAARNEPIEPACAVIHYVAFGWLLPKGDSTPINLPGPWSNGGVLKNLCGKDFSNKIEMQTNLTLHQ